MGGLRRRLVASHFLLVLAVVLVIGIVVLGRVRAYVLFSAASTLRVQTQQIAEVIDRRSGRVGEAFGTTPGRALARLVSRLTAADFAVVDEAGRIVASSERLGRLSGGVFKSDVIAKALAENRVTSATYRDPLGRVSVIAAAPVGDAQGGVAGAIVLVRPVKEVTQTTAGLLVLAVQGLLVGLALSLAVSLVLARNLTGPLLALEGAASRVAAGDFSQRVKVEANDEIGRVAASFNAMAERLGELQRERQDLYASVSHELRTPVTAIKGFAQALEESVGGPDERLRHLAIIQEEASRLERLVNDLFSLARLEGGQVSFDWRRVDLGPLVADAVGKYQPQAEKAGVRLGLAATVGGTFGPGPVVRGDPDRLNQVLANLIENALRFTPRGGHVTVSLTAAGGAGGGRVGGGLSGRGDVLLSVADTGPGIPEADLGRVFERFYTVDRSRARKKDGAGGTGLGLAIAKEIVQAHGGRIWAGQGPEGGALLSLTLPLEQST
jgi:signal transduction histidine kinase